MMMSNHSFSDGWWWFSRWLMDEIWNHWGWFPRLHHQDVPLDPRLLPAHSAPQGPPSPWSANHLHSNKKLESKQKKYYSREKYPIWFWCRSLSLSKNIKEKNCGQLTIIMNHLWSVTPQNMGPPLASPPTVTWRGTLLRYGVVPHS